MMTPTKVKQRQDTQRMRSHLPILLSLLQSKQKKMVASIVITGSAEVPLADEGECRVGKRRILPNANLACIALSKKPCR